LKLDKLFLSVLCMLLLVSAVSSLTLDELLSSYDWNVNNANMVNSVSYTNIDSDSNGKFDTISFNITITGNGNFRYIGFLGEQSSTGQKTVPVSGVLQLNFSSSDFSDGYYNFSFKILDSSNNLLVDAYDNLTYHFDSSLHEPAKTTPSLTAVTMQNTDADTLYELLTYTFQFDTNKSGTYSAILYLSNSAGDSIAAKKDISLVEGISSQTISFSSADIRKARFNGTLTLDSIQIKAAKFNKIFKINNQTAIDSELFDPEATVITGNFADKGIDLNSNTLYDALELNFSANFNQSATYSIIGSVDDYYAQHVLDFNQTQYYAAGSQKVSIRLNGTDFKESEISGPYKISFIKIVQNSNTLDTAIDPYTITNSTYYTDFDSMPLADLKVKFYEIRNLGNNYSAIKVRVENSGQKFVLRANVELYNDKADTVGSSSAYFIMPGGYEILEFPHVYTAGTDTLTAFVDIFDIVEESNETNNFDKANTTLQLSMLYNATSGIAPLSIAFSAVTGKGNYPFYYTWDFGDKTGSSEQSPVKIFSAGTYIVKLIVKDLLGIEARANVTIASQSSQDTVPPNSVTGLAAQSIGESWIYWTWTNPADSDFSRCIIYLDGVNIANTSNNYYNTTGLNPDTNYGLKIFTADTSGNINTTDVSLRATTLSQSSNATASIAGLKLNKYWLYGARNQNVAFNAGWYYPEAGITSVLWDFGDSSTSSSISAQHAYTANGNYTVTLTINSAVVENMTVFVTDDDSSNYNSPIPYFYSQGSNYELLAACFGNDAINCYVTDYDTLGTYVAAKIDGDSNITPDQIIITTYYDTYPSSQCWSIGSSYFKCFFDPEYTDDITNFNNSFTLSLNDDTAATVASLNMFVISENQGPTVTLASSEQYKREGSFDIDYSITDFAFSSVIGSGIGKIRIYKDGTLSQALNPDSGSYSDSFAYTPAAIAEGQEQQHQLCITAEDRTRLSSSNCINLTLDKKSPVLNLLNISGLPAQVPRQGVNVTVTANISDLLNVTAYADFSKLNINAPSGYSNKQADSCVKKGSYWSCTWNNITVKLNSSGSYNIITYISDLAGNSAVNTVAKTMNFSNSAPALTISSITVNEGQLITLNPVVSDPENDTVSVSYSGWMNSQTHQTNYTDSGAHQVNVTATDIFGGSTTKTITVTVNNVAVPDLEISNISYRPLTPFAGQQIMLYFTITNKGETAANAVTWVMQDSQASVSQQQNTFSLAPGEDMVVYAIIVYPSAGTFNPTIKLDSANSITEIDETNNQRTMQIVVG
jgi:PKD repeat protein